MDDEEKKVLDLLGAAYVAFAELEVLHPADVGEFVHAVHAAQNIVLARGSLRAMRNVGVFTDAAKVEAAE
jgi:hypothetical protein